MLPSNYHHLYNFLPDLLMGELLPSFKNDQEIKAQCKCQSIESCLWSKRIVKAIGGVNQNHVIFEKINKHFEERTCGDGKVFCCNDQKSPTGSQLKVLKNQRLSVLFFQSYLKLLTNKILLLVSEKRIRQMVT